MKRLPDLEYISVAEAKAKLSEKLRGIEKRDRRFAITSHGKPKAVLIGYKDYISLVENMAPAISKKISLSEWRKKKGARKKVVESITSLFDKDSLTKKGQKRYKKDATRKMEKTKK